MLNTGMNMAMSSSYDMLLVVLSIVVAIVASYTALNLAGRVTAAQGGSRTMWLLGGATAMGIGIWSMHFIAMLAFSLPVPISYHIGITLFSMIAAILASAIALFIVSRNEMGVTQLLLGGVLMGVGIGVMHYSGMAAVQVDATVSYDPVFFLLSVVIAVVVSVVALWLSFHLRNETGGIGLLQKGISAIVMGGAIVGLHYTAMMASNFMPTSSSATASAGAGMNTSSLAWGVGVGTLLV
ncbi:MAG: MHYT domain-containing protein, partial [Blastocatellia bacterium]